MTGNLTAIVTNKTRYVDDNDNKVNLLSGLCRDVAVNAIIGKPTLKNWKCIVNFDSDYLNSNRLYTKFMMTYKTANSGMPLGIKFDIKDFKQPERLNLEGKALVVSLYRDSIGIYDSPRNDPNTGDPSRNMSGHT